MEANDVTLMIDEMKEKEIFAPFGPYAGPPQSLKQLQEVTVTAVYDPSPLVFRNAAELEDFLGSPLTADHLKQIDQSGGFPVTLCLQSFSPTGLTPGECPTAEVNITPEN